MDAGEQAALAPFVGQGTLREAPAHGEALALERRQSCGDVAGLQTEWQRQRTRRHRSKTLEPSAQNLDERFLA